MNGIGQEMQVIMPDLQDALMQHSAKQRQFDAANQLAQGGNGWGGIGEILGAALGAYKSNKFGGELDKSQADINTQIAQFQEQKEELAQMEQAKAQKSMQDKIDALTPVIGQERAIAAAKAGVDPKEFLNFDSKAADRDQKLALQNDQQAFSARQTADQRAYDEANKKPDFSLGDGLRKEFQGLKPVKDFEAVQSAMKKVASSAENPNPATDIALITSYMKIIDPGSTVREGEFATAANAGSIDEKIRSQYNSMLNGQRLTPEQRDYFVDSAGRLYGAQAQQYQQLENQYGELAARQGLNPEDIFIKREVSDYSKPKQEQAQQSKPTTLGGKQYIQKDGQWFEL